MAEGWRHGAHCHSAGPGSNGHALCDQPARTRNQRATPAPARRAGTMWGTRAPLVTGIVADRHPRSTKFPYHVGRLTISFRQEVPAAEGKRRRPAQYRLVWRDAAGRRQEATSSSWAMALQRANEISADLERPGSDRRPGFVAVRYVRHLLRVAHLAGRRAGPVALQQPHSAAYRQVLIPMNPDAHSAIGTAVRIRSEFTAGRPRRRGRPRRSCRGRGWRARSI